MKACHVDGCTVNQTGVCVLANDPASCPNYQEVDEILESLGGAVLTPPVQNPTFPRSAALGSDDVSAMLGQRYGSVVGLLGAPDSGKTASLVSMYLLMANNAMSGYTFARSRSLIAFEEIARGARRWTSAGPPDQMTTHTEMGDDRSAGMLHLRLQRRTDRKKFDVFLPDLPGEWTNAFIDQNVSERLDFLKSANAIWLMMDGSAFFQPERRAHAVHRMCRLVDRLGEVLSGRRANVILVVTRRDLGLPDSSRIQPIVSRALGHGISLKVAHIASFSGDQAGIPAGMGISELLDETLRSDFQADTFWPDEPAGAPHARQALNFGKFGGH